jgi:hypothetical protein
LFNCFVDKATIDMAEVEVSGCDAPNPFAEFKLPDGVLEFSPLPASDPFIDAAELTTPPALAEVSEYTEDTERRFDSISASEGLVRSAGSGN